ncbi:hypothetical protein FOS14_23145 [Skermania sp. ID1734]|uniref:hypothetical protein n=1 Tax=Skermania sp. ID1734 TaxID=2597516 RepID=UPI00117F1ACD|nr:hypothetical protein [Skermania sp. ID1734]TSD93451.1 hypothetical protein FOS14_23145 [Skermania sp. ID1734]
MSVAIVVLLVLNVVVLLALLRQTRRIGQRNSELAEEVAASAVRAAKPMDIEPLFAGTRGRLITIEILNPVELARTQSRFSGVAGAVAPNLLRKVVYERAAQIMREQLLEQGVDAEVKIHVATG